MGEFDFVEWLDVSIAGLEGLNTNNCLELILPMGRTREFAKSDGCSIVKS